MASPTTLHNRRKAAQDPAVRGALYRDIVGASGRMQRIFRLVRKVARTDSTALLIGSRRRPSRS